MLHLDFYFFFTYHKNEGRLLLVVVVCVKTEKQFKKSRKFNILIKYGVK